MIITTHNKSIGGFRASGIITPPRLGGGTPPPAWSPPNKAGLVHWVDASQEVGLANNDPMSTLTQFSGSFVNGTQVGAARPTFQTNIQNGKPGIRFTSSSSQYFTFGTAIPTNWATNAPLWVVTVLKAVTKGAGQFGVFTCIATNTTAGNLTTKRPFAMSIVEGNATYGNTWVCFPDSTATTGVNSTTDFVGTAGVFSAAYNGSGPSTAANYEFRRDDTPLTEVASGTGQITSSLSLLGAWSGSGTPTLFYNGWLFEQFAYNTLPSAQDYLDVAGYVSPKWGTP